MCSPCSNVDPEGCILISFSVSEQHFGDLNMCMAVETLLLRPAREKNYTHCMNYGGKTLATLRKKSRKGVPIERLEGNICSANVVIAEAGDFLLFCTVTPLF